MNKRILFNIASRNRPFKCYNLIRNLQSMVESDNYTICLKTDSDDPAIQDYPIIGDSYRLRGKSENKINAINRNIPADGWDIIVDLSDDFVITRKGFDNIIREHCGPDDCLHFPEPYATAQNIKDRNENIIILACIGKDYYNRFGYIYNPIYKSLWCDNEITAVAKKLGRYKFVDEEIFYHAHPAAGYGVKDKQTIHTESFNKVDKKTYLDRKAKGFPL